MQFQPVHLLPIAFAEGSSASPLFQFLPFVFVFAIFYFLLIAPMRKRQKALQAMIAALKKGDKVVTNGGLYGEVAAVQEDRGDPQAGGQRQGAGRQVGDLRPRGQPGAGRQEMSRALALEGRC